MNDTGDPLDHTTDWLFQVDDREAKLPRWTQELLRHARRRVRTAEADAAQARGETDPANSVMLLNTWRTHDGMHPIGLGTKPTVTAALGRRRPDGSLVDYIDFTVNGEYVEVRGSTQLLVIPEVTNAIILGLRH